MRSLGNASIQGVSRLLGEEGLFQNGPFTIVLPCVGSACDRGTCSTYPSAGRVSEIW